MWEWEFVGDSEPPPPPMTESEFIEQVTQVLTDNGATGALETDDLDLVTQDEWEEFILGLLGFFNETGPQGADQNSYYDDHSNEAPLTAAFINAWNWLPSIQNLPGYHYYDYLNQDIDPEFLEWAYAVRTIVDVLHDGGGSLSAIEGMQMTIVVGGVQLRVTWHGGNAPGENLHANPNDPSEIIVTAATGYFTVECPPALLAGDPGGSGGGDGSGAQSHDTDPPIVTVELTDFSKAGEVFMAALQIAMEINRLTPLIMSIADNAQITMADGSSISGADLKALWGRIDFRVTDRTFGPDRAGAFDFTTGIATINAGVALGWNAWPNGLAFIMIHELVHSSELGRLTDVLMWQMHLGAGLPPGSYDSSSPYFQENEEYANIGARGILTTLGLSLDADFDPPNGYEFGDLSH